MYGLNHRGQKGLDVSIACASLIGAAVALRIAVKLAYKTGLHMDDLWIVLAFLSTAAEVAVQSWGSITGGGGREMKEILESKSKDTYVQLANYLEGLLLAWTIYLLCAFTIKMSLLSLYRRIFATHEFRQVSLGVMLVSVLWFVAAQIGNFVICIPFDSFWNRLKPGRCLNFNVYALSVGVVDVVIDSVVLALPLREILSLHLPTHKKVGLLGIFLLGIFTIVTGIIRVKLMYQPHSIYVRFSAAVIWSNVHLLTASVCACLPVYKPLWQALDTVTTKLSNIYRSRFSKSTVLPSFVHGKDSARRAAEREKSGLRRPQAAHVSLKGLPVSSFGSLGNESENGKARSMTTTIPEDEDLVRMV